MFSLRDKMQLRKTCIDSWQKEKTNDRTLKEAINKAWQKSICIVHKY